MQNQETEPQTYLTEQQVAEILAISKKTLTKWRSQRRGPAYLRISHRCVRYDQAALEQWIASHIVVSRQRTEAAA